MDETIIFTTYTILRAFQIETKEARQKNNHQIRVEKCGEVNSETDSRR